MSKTPSVDDSLAEPSESGVGRRVAKNLHIVIPAVVVGALAVVLLFDAMKQEQADQVADDARLQAEMRNTARTDLPSPEELLLRQIRAQEEAARLKREEEERLRAERDRLAMPSVPGAPAVDPTASLPPVPQGRPAGEARSDESKERMESIRASGIMAISRTQTRGGEPDTGDGRMSEADRIREQARRAREDAERQRAQLMGMSRQGAQAPGAGAPQGEGVMAGPGPMRTSSNQAPPRSDAEWRESVAASSGTQEPIKLDPINRAPLLHQGAIIPAALITEINSDLPGQITAIVRMDVYDSLNGSELLIPKGSRLIGGYNTDVRPGQERVMAAFQRLIRPDGTSVDLAGMGAADAMGQAGVSDQVNTHFWKMFRTSFMIAGVAWLADRNQPDTVVVNNTGRYDGQTPGQMTGEILSDISTSVLERNRQIPVTLTIRKGHTFNIMVNRDIQIPPYRQ